MSADIDAIPMASDAFKAVGVTTGASTRLAITDIASNRAISRRRTMPYPATANKGLEVALLHKWLAATKLRFAAMSGPIPASFLQAMGQAAMQADWVSSNRSSSVAATRLCEPNGSAIEIPRAAADLAIRSVMRPWARNHGATTRRRAPRPAGGSPPRRRSDVDRSRTPPRRPPSRSGRQGGRQSGRALVRRLVRRAHRNDDDSDVSLVGRHSRFGQASSEQRDQRGVLAENIGLTDDRGPLDPLDHCGQVDSGVVGVGQQHRDHHGRPVAPNASPARRRAYGSDFSRTLRGRPAPAAIRRIRLPEPARPPRTGDQRCRGRRG